MPLGMELLGLLHVQHPAKCCVQGLLVQLKQEDDEMSQLDALGQLNELLSISNEESLSMFPLDQLIPTLVRGMP